MKRISLLSKRILSNVKWQFFAAVFLLVIAGVCVFSNTVENAFVLDDYDVIVKNSSIRDISKIPVFLSRFFNRSIFYVSLVTNYVFSGLDPRGYHLFNSCLHISNSILLFILLFLFLKVKIVKDITWYLIPLMASLIFLLHPIQALTINHIATRSVMLCTFFSFCALIFYVLALKRFFNAAVCHLCCALAFLFFLCALASKSIAVSLPVLAILFFYVEREETENSVFPFSIFSAYSLMFVLFTAAIFLVFFTGNIWQRPYHSIFVNFATQIEVIFRYLILFFLPRKLVPEYDVPYKLGFDCPLCGASVVLLCLMFFIWKKRKKFPYIFLGFFFFIVAILPSSSFIPRINSMLLYRLYFPIAGLSIAFASVLRMPFTVKHNRAKPIIMCAAVFYVLCLGVMSIGYNTLFTSNLKLWKHIAGVLPDSYIAHYNVGTYTIQEERDFTTAIKSLERSIELKGDFAKAYFHLGLALHQTNDIQGALRVYAKALKLEPSRYDYYANFGNAFFALGEFLQAIRCYEIYLKNYAEEAPIYSNLCLAYLRVNQFPQALEACDKAIKLSPDNKNFQELRKLVVSNIGRPEGRQRSG